MNSRHRPSRLGFRTQLALTIAVVFIAAGAILLMVQNLIVRALFDHAIGVSGACVSVRNDDGTATRICSENSGDPVEPLHSPAPGTHNVDDAVLRQSTLLNDIVSSGLLWWSIVVLMVFAIAAALIAHWLSKRALHRIADITATTNTISEQDLGRRLDLSGPDDEVKELGDTIDRMLDRLQTAFAAQDRFVANASHELRTPLSTVRTSLEVPLIQGTVPENLQSSLRRALRANEKSERLIAALLTLARSQAQKIEQHALRPDQIVKAEVNEMSELAASRSVTVETSFGTLIPDIYGDGVLVRQAVHNLIDNAIRHNHLEGEVAVSVGTQGNSVVIEVANTGPLLTQAEVALLTEPFHRGSATRTAARESIGLGLAIVASIAQAHGGRLLLSPRPAGGLVAKLVFPTQ